jgi:hypothetical protein
LITVILVHPNILILPLLAADLSALAALVAALVEDPLAAAAVLAALAEDRPVALAALAVAAREDRRAFPAVPARIFRICLPVRFE